MARTALDRLTTTWFKPYPESDVEYFIRPLSGLEMREAGEHAELIGENIRLSAALCRVVLTHGLVGWKNFRDSEGEVRFSADQSVNLQRLPFDDTLDITKEILNRSRVSPADEKKS